jgi:hypothetical protein
MLCYSYIYDMIFTTQFLKSNIIIYNLSVCTLNTPDPQDKFGLRLCDTVTALYHLKGLHGASNMLIDFLDVPLRSVIDRFLSIISKPFYQTGWVKSHSIDITVRTANVLLNDGRCLHMLHLLQTKKIIFIL